MADQEQPQDQKLINKPKTYKYPENDPNYKGNKLDQNLRYGMIQNRSCTDCICLLLFIAMWVGFIFNSIIGFENGNPKIMVSPYDSSGNQCGLTSGFEDYEYIYFPYPKNPKLTVCIKKCPNSKNFGSLKSLDCKPNKVVTNCTNSTSFQIYPTNSLVTACIPTSNEVLKQIGSEVMIDNMTKHMNDLRITWPLFFGCAGISFIIGFFLMWTMQYCVKILIWMQIIMVQILLVVSAIFFYNRSEKLKLSDPQSNSHTTFMALSILMFVLSAVYLLLVCCIFKKIKLCAEIMEQSADFITDVPKVMLIPIITFLITISFFAFWVSSTLFIHTQGISRQNGSSPFASIKWNKNVQYQLAFNIFALIWNIEFIVAFGFFIIASSVGFWYFTPGEGVNEKKVDRPIRKSIYNLLRYHIGSIAFGSIILVIIWIIRSILHYIHEQFKEKADQSDALQGCIKCCCQYMECCFDCFERFIRFLNLNAYIIVSITGKSFCSAAHEAFYMIVKNPIRFAALKWIGTFFIFFGQLFIISISSFSCYLIITNLEYYETRLFSPVAPLIFFIVISYIISSIFMGVHGISTDTILLAFCIDEEIHKYSSENPKFSSQKLNKFISNNHI